MACWLHLFILDKINLHVGCSSKMHLSFTIMVVYLLPILFICCQGSPLNIGDQKLIIVDPSYYVPDMKDYDIGS